MLVAELGEALLDCPNCPKCPELPLRATVGLGLMLLAELGEALRLVLTQKLLTNLKFGVIEGQYAARVPS